MNFSLITRDIWNLLGLPFDCVLLQEAVERVNLAINNSERIFLSTPNLNFVIATQSDPVFFQSIVDSDLVVADGMPVIWVAKLLGLPITERVAGSDLFDRLSQQQERGKKISVFFFGGQAGVAERACQALNESSVAMQCCGFYDPGFVSVDEMSTPAIIDIINKANPDFLVVALGARKGQEWIQKNRYHLNATVISHLGAVINFVVGHVERAPVVWQRCGLEWLWRIRQEPTLWRRYFFDGLAFAKLIVSKVFPLVIYDRWLKHSGVIKKTVNIRLDDGEIKLAGSAHHEQLDVVKNAFSYVLQDAHGDVVLDCLELVYIDAAFIATLMLFQRYLNEENRQLYLVNVSRRIFLLLDLNNVSSRFQIKIEKNLCEVCKVVYSKYRTRN